MSVVAHPRGPAALAALKKSCEKGPIGATVKAHGQTRFGFTLGQRVVGRTYREHTVPEEKTWSTLGWSKTRTQRCFF